MLCWGSKIPIPMSSTLSRPENGGGSIQSSTVSLKIFGLRTTKRLTGDTGCVATDGSRNVLPSFPLLEFLRDNEDTPRQSESTRQRSDWSDGTRDSQLTLDWVVA